MPFGNSLIRIAIVDAHAIVRFALRALLDADSRFNVVAEAAVGQVLLSVIQDNQPHLIVLDMTLPDGNGLDVLAALQRRGISLPAILLFSMTCFEDDVRRAYDLGVQGYVLKTDDWRSILTQAVVNVVQGVPTFDTKIVRVRAGLQRSTTGQPLYSDGSAVLSPCEREVVAQMQFWETYEEIACALGRGRSTVRSQAASALAKLGVRSRHRALIRAIELGIIRPDLTKLPGATITG